MENPFYIVKEIFEDRYVVAFLNDAYNLSCSQKTRYLYKQILHSFNDFCLIEYDKNMLQIVHNLREKPLQDVLEVFLEYKRYLDNIQDHNRREEFSLIEMNLKEGKNIVIDDTNLTRRIRHNHIMRIKKHNARIVGVFFDLSMQRIKLQNSRRERRLESHILFHMKKQLEPPSYDEGFDYIQRIDDKFIL